MQNISVVGPEMPSVEMPGRQEMPVRSDDQGAKASVGRVGIGDYCCALVCPCYLCEGCCSTYGAAIARSDRGDMLLGEHQVLGYITSVKETVVSYEWTVECYYETPSTEGGGGDTVYLQGASEKGTLVTVDRSVEPFVLLTSKQNVALSSEVCIDIDTSFRTEYEDARDNFYAARKKSLNHPAKVKGCKVKYRFGEHKYLPTLKGSQHIQWTSEPMPLPWWATNRYKRVAALTCCGPCWLYRIHQFMGLQVYTFRKTCTGFAGPQPVPGQEASTTPAAVVPASIERDGRM